MGMSHKPQRETCVAHKMQEYLNKGLACCQDNSSLWSLDSDQG